MSPWASSRRGAVVLAVLGAVVGCSADGMTEEPPFGPPPSTGAAGGTACTEHGQCLSRVCALGAIGASGDRRCLAPAQVLYVGGGARCRDLPQGGDIFAPLCKIKDALVRGGGNPLIRLLPGTFSAVDGDLLPVGAIAEIYGSDASEPDWLRAPAVLRGDGQGEAVLLTTRAQLTLDAVRVESGLRCESSDSQARLRLTRSTVSGVGGVGLQSDGCEVRLSDSVFARNQDGALWLRRSTFTISDSIFRENTSPFNHAAIRISADSAGSSPTTESFARNQILHNRTRDALPAGLDCGPGESRPLLQTTLCGNTADVEQRQSSGNCNFIQPRLCP